MVTSYLCRPSAISWHVVFNVVLWQLLLGVGWGWSEATAENTRCWGSCGSSAGATLTIPCILLGDSRVPSLAVTREPRVGVAVTRGSVARFAKRLLSSDVLARFLFPFNSTCTEYSLLLAVIACQLVKVKVCDQPKDSLNTSAIIVVLRDYNRKET